MPYHTEFTAGVEAFLGRYAVSVAGGMTNNAHGGGTVQNALANAGFVLGARRSEVSLAAPRLYAYFALNSPAPNRDKLPFSKDQVNVTLGPDDLSGTGVPVYVIPYEGARGLGVQLPDQATDHQPEAWALTATQNGCTVEISGSRESPYASHTNVRDADAANRQTKVNTRLDKLQQRFQVAAQHAFAPLPVPGQHDPTRNRTQFGFYAPNGVNPAHNYLGYQQHSGVVAKRIENQTFKGARISTGITTHTRYYLTPTAATIAAAQNPAIPPNALVVGHRINNRWTFYYQEYQPMQFEVQEVRKFGPKVRTHTGWLMDRTGMARKEFSAMVILSHGQLWPNTVGRDETFQ